LFDSAIEASGHSEQTLDVLTEGELVEKGRRVRIIGHTGADAVVKEVD
jgi:hypothetical protein